MREHLQRLRMLARAYDSESLLVEAGMLEQAVIDAICTREDGWGGVQVLFRDLLLTAGRIYVADCDAETARSEWNAVLPLLDTLGRADLPHQVTARVPEGYLHYALDPRDYARAARTYVRDAGGQRARRAVVIGVRSIGTSLSGVVAAVTGSHLTLTLRPRGESGGRYIAADAVLMSRLRTWAAEERDMLIVDEGPGATGETLYCIGQWLRHLGIPDSRIMLFPSHTGGMGLAPPERRDWFATQVKFPPPADGERLNRVAQAFGFSAIESLSGGLWRRIIPGGASVSANVNHERLKYRARDARGDTYVLRYAGIGVCGQEVFERACSLALLGVGPDVAGFQQGFMAYRWQEGTVSARVPAPGSAFTRAVGGYLRARWNRFGTGKAAVPASLIPALRENACEALGADPPGLADAVRKLETLPEREAVIADARMQPVEWVETARGYMKVDAWDHGDGIRLPGPVDPAWDYAAAAVEFGWGESDMAAVLDRLSLPESSRHELQAAIAAYRAPYAACCLGEADIAAREVQDERDRRLLEHETQRYRKALKRELHYVRAVTC